MRALVTIAVLGALAGPARATPHHAHWYQGPYGRNRLLHLTITVTGGLMYVASETVFKHRLAPAPCRWCSVDGLDAGVRDALVWHDRGTAGLLSNIDGYFLVPAAGFGLVLAGTAMGPTHGSLAAVIDDAVPILETVTLSQLLTQAVKFSVGRQRPYAHYGPAGPPSDEDNLSFFSGHSALGFGIAVSAGMIAHRRHYRTEPYIWAIGLTLATSTAYLRIAADRHYLTDVLTGSAVGALAGLTVPLLMKRDVEVVPTRNGLAIAGVF